MGRSSPASPGPVNPSGQPGTGPGAARGAVHSIRPPARRFEPVGCRIHARHPSSTRSERTEDNRLQERNSARGLS
jgi:hypothetical protein